MTSNPNLRTVAKAIIQNPGITVKGITKLTGLPSRRVRGALITLESCGFLISEDDQGRLYPFDPYETGSGHIVADLIAQCPSRAPGAECPSGAPGAECPPGPAQPAGPASDRSVGQRPGG